MRDEIGIAAANHLGLSIMLGIGAHHCSAVWRELLAGRKRLCAVQKHHFGLIAVA